MGLGLASSSRLIWVTLSSVGGSRCSKRISQRVFGVWSKDLYLTESFLYLHILGGLLKPYLPKVLWRCCRHWYLTSTMMCLTSDYGVWPLRHRGWRDWNWHIAQPPASSMIIIRGFPFWNEGRSSVLLPLLKLLSFLCWSSSQDHLLGHTPYSPSFWVHLTCNDRIEEVQSRFLSLRKSLVVSYWDLKE